MNERNRRDFEYLNTLPAEQRAAALRGEGFLPPWHPRYVEPVPVEPDPEPVAAALVARRPPVSPAPHHREQDGRRHLILRSASECAPAPVEWLWPRRIALGALTLLGGAEGSGKSTLLAHIAAAVTTGAPWPCREGRAPPGRVFLLSSEDSASNTTSPRLAAAGADLRRVHYVSVGEGSYEGTFNLRTDVSLLADKLRSLPDARLVVIDPISSYLGGADSHRNDRMRELLDPLAAVAAKHRVAVIAVTHPPKGRSQDPRDQFIGSVAFNAAARASFLLERDPVKSYRRLLLQVKNNLCPEAGTLAFTIAPREVAPNINGLYVIFEPNHASLSVRDVLGSRSARRLERAEAEHFLRDHLQAGTPVAVAELEQAARAAGLIKAGQPISQCWALRDARAALGIEVRRSGFGASASYAWALPGRG